MNIRVFTTYPRGDASRRLRIDPLVEEFRRAGHTVRVHELFTDWMFRRKNRRLLWRWVVVASLIVRLAVRLVVLWQRSDMVLVHREVFPFGTPRAERWAASRARLAVLDVDDAIFTTPTHGRDWRRFARNPAGAFAFAEVFDLILCGSPELVEQLGGGRAVVRLAPTCPPPTDQGKSEGADRRVLWTGSQSTLPSLRAVLPEVLRACEALDLVLVVLGGANVRSLPEHERLEVAEWSERREELALRECGIGIMPLPDTAWERGKSGYKAILYLASGLIAVISPVGYNAVLVADFQNALAHRDDWGSELASARLRFLDEFERVTGAREARAAFDATRVARESVKAVLAQWDHSVA